MTSIDELFDPAASDHMVPTELRAGAMRAEVVTVDLGDVIISMGDHSFPVATRGETRADRVGLAVPLRLILCAHVNGEPVGLGVAYAFGGAAEVAATIGGPADF